MSTPKYQTTFADGTVVESANKIQAFNAVLERHRQLYFPHIYGAGHLSQPEGRRFWATIEDYHANKPPVATLHKLDAAELVAAQAPLGMTRDEAFSLLEAHCGTDATFQIHPPVIYRWTRNGVRETFDSNMWTVQVESARYSRNTLSEAVAAVVGNLPKGDA